jgi:general secretion pathway protein M
MATRTLNSWTAVVRSRWLKLAQREQRAVTLAAAVVVLGLVWLVLLGPALQSLQRAQSQAAQLDQSLESMLRLQQRAQALQAQVAVPPQDALQLLQKGVAAMGSRATLQLLGEQVTVTLIGVDANALAQWLGQTGVAARIRPLEVHLVRDAGSVAQWSGTLVFVIPASL